MTRHRRDTIREGKRTLRIEAEAVKGIARRLGPAFADAVGLLFNCSGKVVVTGIGKTGLVGQKLASTLASTGTSSVFLHSAEGAHGDLGVLGKGDVVIAISNSGESDEIGRLIPAIKRLGLPLIALTGRATSSLAAQSDVVLDVSCDEEACPLGLAPTASTTAALAMGDALAVALLKLKGFREEDFALLHPGGKLGRRWLKVSDLMHSGPELPLVGVETPLKDAVYKISSGKLGVALVTDARGLLCGIITDGDLRRMIEANVDFYHARVGEVMHPHPRRIDADSLGAGAVQLMEEHSITSLAVTDDQGRPVGLIHLHDLLKAGVV